jgi:transporter family-2 protein
MKGMGVAILAFLAGVAVLVQAAINAELARGTGHSLWAAVISFGLGFTVLFVAAVVIRLPWPETTALAEIPLWAWTGGAAGATFVFLSIIAVQRLGAATLVAFVVAGQMVAALVMDHFGWLGLTEHGLTAWRVLGAVLLVAGVVLIRVF